MPNRCFSHLVVILISFLLAGCSKEQQQQESTSLSAETAMPQLVNDSITQEPHSQRPNPSQEGLSGPGNSKAEGTSASSPAEAAQAPAPEQATQPELKKEISARPTPESPAFGSGVTSNNKPTQSSVLFSGSMPPGSDMSPNGDQASDEKLEVEPIESIIVQVSSQSPPSEEALERLYQALESESTPSIALRRIEAFLNFYELSEFQKNKINTIQEDWSSRKKENLIKNKGSFVSAEEFNEKETLSLRRMMTVNEMALARQPVEAVLTVLDRAYNETSNAEISYFCGLIKGIWANETGEALVHFRRVLAEIPDHSGALNNIAICEMKSGNYSRALGTWRKSLEGNLNHAYREDVIHNVIHALNIAREKKARFPASFTESCSRLLAACYDDVTELNVIKSRGDYWRFSPWLANPDKAVKILGLRQRSQIPAQDLRVGTKIPGLAVGGELVLVHQKSLETPYIGMPHQLKIVTGEGQSATKSHQAEIVAINDELELALLRCRGLNAAGFNFSTSTPTLDESIFLGNWSEKQGTVFRLAQVESVPHEGKAFLGITSKEIHSASLASPIFNNQGDLMGLLSPINSADNTLNVRYFWSASVLEKFIQSSAAEFNVHSDKSRDLSEDSLQESLKKHLVEIQLVYPESSLSLDRVSRSPFSRQHYLTDCSCLHCDRRTHVACRHKGCANGRVSRKYQEVVSRTAKGAPIYATKFASDPCPVCRGRGTVPCGICSNGMYR